jgi:hypothetical protein
MKYDVPEPTPPSPAIAAEVAKYPGYRIKPETAKLGKKYVIFYHGRIYVGTITHNRSMYYGDNKVVHIFFDDENGKYVTLGMEYNPDGSIMEGYEDYVFLTIPHSVNALRNKNTLRKMVNRHGVNRAVSIIKNANDPNASFSRRHNLLAARKNGNRFYGGKQTRRRRGRKN